MSRTKPSVFDSVWFKVVSWLGTLFIGFLGTFLIFSIPADLVDTIYYVFSGGKSILPYEWYVLVFAMAALMATTGLVTVLLGPKVSEVDVVKTGLPQGLEGFKIAQISDLHIGPTIQTRYVNRVVRKTNAMQPDIIVLTGDIVDAHTDSIRKHLEPLSRLSARHGVYYVTGNHEYYWGVQTLLPELEKRQIKLLINETKVVAVNGSKVAVSGVPDPVGAGLHESHRPNIKKVAATAIADFKILLAHRPDPYHEAEEHGFDLQLSGHTHGGQFFPFSLFVPLAHKYYRGLNKYKNLWVYINRGTGYWGPANRFAVASEISLIKLSKT